MFETMGGCVMVLAAIALFAVGVDLAFRLGGNGMLIGLACIGCSIMPAMIGARYLDVPMIYVMTWAMYAATAVLVLLGVLAVAMMLSGEQSGIVALGIALVMTAALYAIVPGMINARRLEATVTVPKAAGA